MSKPVNPVRFVNLMRAAPAMNHSEIVLPKFYACLAAARAGQVFATQLELVD